MLVADRFVLVRMPRTASTWSQRVCVAVRGFNAREVGPPSRGGHITLREACMMEPGLSDGKVSYVQVRHPLAWLASVWSWMSFNQGWRTLPGPIGKAIAAPRCVRFRDFVGWVTRNRPGVIGRMYDAYTEGVTRVGRTENCAQTLADALKEAGYPVTAKGLNKARQTNPSPNRPELTDDLAERLFHVEQPVYERFGYDITC